MSSADVNLRSWDPHFLPFSFENPLRDFLLYSVSTPQCFFAILLPVNPPPLNFSAAPSTPSLG